MNIQKLNNEDFFEEEYSVVSNDTKEKISKLKNQESKNQSLGAELLLIKCLKQFGIDYNKAEFTYNKYCKFYTENEKQNFESIYFNKSHSKEYAMCVVGNLNVGCDIQQRKHKYLFDLQNNKEVLSKQKEINLAIAKKYYNKKEYDMLLAQCDLDKQMNLFYDLWSLKESFVKCIGTGFNKELFSVDMSGANSNLEISYNGNKYYLKKLNLINDYSTSLCFENNVDEDIQVTNFNL